MQRFVLLALALVAVSQVQAKDTCPWAIGKYPFDDAKFAGAWYVIASIPPKDTLADQKKCMKMNVASIVSGSETSMTIQKSYLEDGKTIKAEVFTKPLIPEKSTSMFQGVWKKEGETTWSDIYKTSIVATDYDTYAVVISCKSNFDADKKKFGRNLMASILSRKTTLGEETLKTLMNIISSYDIPMTEIKMMTHTGCTY